ncbi:MAG TPA: nucleoside monophosphate kinase [Terrimicrobiaceae bacterium]|jgi:adenylate kinase|nr:nucleoside monophosphate kinase [Terrimicrobiaceae bacterium]
MINRIVLLGPPASGKGTQAALLSATFGIPAASTGAILRDEKTRGADVGIEAERWTAQGELFPDELALRVVWKWLDDRHRFILDGFPRTLGQARSFDQDLEARSLPLDVVYLLNLSDALVRERMTSRLTCLNCASVFNEKFHDVTAGAPCPRCGGELVRRADDTEEALDRRLEQYREHTLPVAHHYQGKDLLREVDVTAGRDAVFNRLYGDIRGELSE